METERDTINIVRDTPIGNDEGGRRSGQGFVLHADIFIIFFFKSHHTTLTNMVTDVKYPRLYS